MADFTLGVVNIWGGECLGGERLTIYLDEGYMSKVDQVNSSAVVLLLKFYNLQTPILIENSKFLHGMGGDWERECIFKKFYSKHHAAERWDLEFGSNTAEKFENSLKNLKTHEAQPQI